MADAYHEVVLTEADKQEIARNKTGKKILLVGIVLIVLACTDTDVAWLGLFGIVAFIAGFFITMQNRTEHQIRETKALAISTVNLMVAKAKAGQKIDLDDTPAARAAKQKEETKKIVKGAVVGGIVAGDAGAVVGATIAKNKIDNEKKK